MTHDDARLLEQVVALLDRLRASRDTRYGPTLRLAWWLGWPAEMLAGGLGLQPETVNGRIRSCDPSAAFEVADSDDIVVPPAPSGWPRPPLRLGPPPQWRETLRAMLAAGDPALNPTLAAARRAGWPYSALCQAVGLGLESVRRRAARGQGDPPPGLVIPPPPARPGLAAAPTRRRLRSTVVRVPAGPRNDF